MVVGYSSITPSKQEYFNTFLNWHLSKYTEKQVQYPYTYIDVTSGPGIDSRYGKGSPVIFLENVKKYNIAFQAFLFEKTKKEFNNLKMNLATITKGMDKNVFF